MQINAIPPKRIYWIDSVKYICIMFVMLSHLSICPDWFAFFFKPFFLGGFFFASGYTYKNNKNFKDFLISKIKGILIPWFVFGIFNILCSQIISFNNQKSFVYDIKCFFLQVRGKNDGLWFLACLFVAYLPFYFIVKYTNKNAGLIITCILCLFSQFYIRYFDGEFFSGGGNSLPWHLQFMFIADFFMLFGYLCKEKNISFFEKQGSIKNFFIITVLYLAILVIFNKIFKCRYTLNTGEPFSWFIVMIFGVLFVVSLAKILPKSNYVSYIGANTLLCFALHGKIEVVIEKILLKLNLYKIAESNLIIQLGLSLLIVIGVSLILIIPIYIINRWFPWTVGKKYAR